MSQPLIELSNGPVELPNNWNKLVNAVIESSRLELLNNSINRGSPFGNIDWIKYQMDGDDLLSLSTGEIFKMTRINKQEGAPPLNKVIEVTYHHNFIGDNGSHYLLMRTFQVDFNVNPPVTTNISETSKCW